jgi:hypothetical protein
MQRIQQSQKPSPRAIALDAVAEAVRKLADAIHLLAVTDEVTLVAPGPRLVTTREPEMLITLDEACALFPGKGSRKRSIQRLAREHPEITRRLGTRLWIERGALLRVTRRTA